MPKQQNTNEKKTNGKSEKDILYLDRELSWLNFNERVLLEADDSSVPLLERLNFLGIFSNNLDEFYRVRVAILKRRINLLQTVQNEIADDEPLKLLKEIHRRIRSHRENAENIYQHICKELEKENIFIINESDLNEEQSVSVKQFFRESVRKSLFPIMLDRFKNYSHLHDNSIYLVVDLTHKDNPAAENLALIELPTDLLTRFYVLPVGADKRSNVMYLDDVIRHCLADIFSVYGFVKFSAYAIKFTRDAELDISNDVYKSILQSVNDGLKQRMLGDTVRFVYDKKIPKKVLLSLQKKFGVKKRDSLEKGSRYLSFRDLMGFPRYLGSKKMQYEPQLQLPVSEFPQGVSMLDVIREKDVMLHYPYQPFRYIIDLLREAAIDPAVRAIKMSIYRAAKDSEVVSALINAARNGKEVIVFVELQARFDERANIDWAGKMQNEGIRVLPSIPGIKVHCKILLIRRKEKTQNVYYAAIGTGNPNEKTTQIYSDEHLLTADKEIAEEVNKVFHTLDDQKYQRPDFKELVVSPFGMREFFLRKIDREIKNAEKGKPAWMIIKINNLVDKKLVKRLYKASRAGVKINLLVRGICSLIPGIEGQSENIQAIRIVDRFLEHSRILVFANCAAYDSGNCGAGADFYIGSADWMDRNLDRRFEVVVPIHDLRIQKELWDILRIQLSDNVKARKISFDKPNEIVPVIKGAKKVCSQSEIYQYLKKSGDS